MIKKILTTALSIAMIFTTIQSASAQIEVWEFDDGSRLTRFHRDDLDDMVALYDQYVQENNRKLFTKGQNIAIKTLGITAGASAVIGGLVLASNPPASAADKFGGTVLIFAGLASIVASFYPEYVEKQVARQNTRKAYSYDERKGCGWLGVEDIRDLLIEERKFVKQILKGESVPIGFNSEWLKNCPGYYVIIERPYKRKYTGFGFFPNFFKDYSLRKDYVKDRCSLFITDLINGFKRDGVYEQGKYVVGRISADGGDVTCIRR